MRTHAAPGRLCVLSLSALLWVTGAACRRTPQQKEAGYLDKGKQYMLKKDYPRAILQFQNAVQVMPRDPEANYQLGLAHLASGNLVAAVADLKKATELNPGHVAAQVTLAEMMALSGIKNVAEEGQHRMQEILRNSPGNIEALDALALNEFQLGDLQSAEKHLQEALDKFPQSAKSSVALARLYLSTRDYKGAEEVLQKAVKETPQSMEAHTALGGLYLLQGRWSGAEEQFQAALKANPQFSLGLFGLASAQMQQGHKDQAEQTYRKIAALPDKQYRHVHAVYLFSEGKRDAAVQEFEKLAGEDPKDRAARSRLVAAYVLTEKTPEAEKVLDKALKANSRDNEALLERSQILLRSGKFKQAEDDLLQVLHYEPGSAQAHYMLAEVYQSRGDTSRQQQELTQALRFAPAFLPARIVLAQNLLVSNHAQSAMDLLDAAPGDQKRNLALNIQRNWGLLVMDRQQEARKEVDRGLAVSRARELLLQDSILKLAKHDYVGARASTQEALRQNPEDWRALRLLAAGYVGQKQPAAASQAIQEHAARYPKSAPIQQFLGEWLLAKGQMAEARAAFAAAKADDPKYAAADLALARLDIAENKIDEARNALTNLVLSNGGDAEASLWLGSIEMKSRNYEAAIGHFRKVLDSEPQNVSALNNLAYLLANFTDQTDEALGLAQKAREAAPDNVDAEGTLGWVFYRKGIYNTALQHLRDAAERDGDSATTNTAIRKYHLAMAYFKLGDRQSGVKALSAAMKINPNLPEAQMVSALFQQTATR